MPEIFSKNCKLKLIEYGSGKQDFEMFSNLKTRIFLFLQALSHR